MKNKNFRLRFRSKVGSTRFGYSILSPTMTLKDGRLSSNTDICIDGYPRSANSFAVRAFREAQSHSYEIAHHSHLAGQVLGAIGMKIPTMVLIRSPLDAASSLVLRIPGTSPETAIRLYLEFHKPLVNVRNGFVLAPFEVVTSNYGILISKLNYQFGTDFQVYSNEDSDKKVFNSFPDFKSDLVSSLPSESKKAEKEKLLLKCHAGKTGRLCAKAIRLYDHFMSN